MSQAVSAVIDQDRVEEIITAVEASFRGRRHSIELALSCLLADGHLLIEDMPGSGKTSLSSALARVMGLDFNRVQCTNDLLPADITGLSIFDRERGEFTVKKGPVFTQILLADELNRAPSKTQSALLQAMEERVVSIDTDTLALPQPFLVIATQNPREQIGTFDLPESQLDRFSISMSIGRPDSATQKQILMSPLARADELLPIMNSDDVLMMQNQVRAIAVTEAILDYILRLADEIEKRCHINLSVRYRQQLLALARATAFIAKRDYVIPDDVQMIVPHSLQHRLNRADKSGFTDVISQILLDVALP